MSEKRELLNVVGGASVAATDGRTTDLVNPTTGEVYATAPLSSDADVDRAYVAAAEAFDSWRDSTPSERQKAMLGIADLLEKHADELVALESENTGKPLALTMSEEIPPMIDQIRFFAGAARLLEGRAAGEYMAGHTSMIRREPIGVIGQVTPWNYPMMMAVWKFAPAIAAGNAVVLKPSDTTPVSTVRMAQLINEAELLPPGVLNVVCGDRDTGRALVEHKIPQMVAITGSVRAGMEVAKSASFDVKRVHLELGGKAPVVVFDDADLEAAIEGISDRRLLQRRAGLHRGHPRPRGSRDLRRLRRGSRRGGARYGDDVRERPWRRGRDGPAGQQRQPARPGRLVLRRRARARLRRRRRQAAG